MPASCWRRSSLKRSLKLFLDEVGSPLAAPDSLSSSSLDNIISGLLIIVAIELAVFRRPVGCMVGEELTSFSFDELRESQVKGLVNRRGPGAGAGCDEVVTGGRGGALAGPAPGLFAGDATEGDQGIAGRALVMLLSERDFVGDAVSVGPLSSSVFFPWLDFSCAASLAGGLVPSSAGTAFFSSSNSTASRLEVCDRRFCVEEESRCDVAMVVVSIDWTVLSCGLSVSLALEVLPTSASSEVDAGGGATASVKGRGDTESTASSKLSFPFSCNC